MEFLVLIPILIFSVIFHEVSHGIVAHAFGDDTAYFSGRITLNPVPHLDPIGSVIFPAVCIFLHMPVFGWARPVPVNPNNFRRYKAGSFCVSLAGPLTNLVIAAACVGILYFAVSQSTLQNQFSFLPGVLQQAILLNLVLAVFNLIPIPPLDGSRIVSALLPWEAARRYESLEPYGFFIMMGLIVLGLLNRILSPAVGFLYHVFMGAAGL